mgnify:CR=1 FL=1
MGKIEKNFSEGRRQFLKASAAVGGGLAVAMHVPAWAQSAGAEAAKEINLWVLVGSDDSVVIRYARSEMGQGSMTSAPQLVAEELGCDWSKVRVEYVSANANAKSRRAWGAMNASGSQTIRSSQDYLRRGGATAREMLVAAAAQGWGVPATECKVDKGVISHAASNRKIGRAHG